jgi:hypothetical protein
MKAVSSQLITEFEGREVWCEAFPLLDEGIAALSTGDRAVVMLRYFERQNFRQIGAALGKSEEAAQKQCERALQRLSGFLKKHGVQVSAALLGTALPSALVQGCPAPLAGEMAREALGAASTFEAKISILKALEAMTRTKLNTAILVAVALGVPLAMQWAENHRLRNALELAGQRLGSARTDATDAGRTGSNAVAVISRNERSAARAGKVERDAVGAEPDAANDRVGGVAQWKHALFMSDPLLRSQRLAELLSELRAEDGPAIAAAFEEARGSGIKFAEEHRLFLRAWGKIGGVAAVEYAVKQNGDGSDEAVAALGGWASGAPALARTWLDALPESDAKESLVYGLLDGWSTTDFHAAAAYAETRPSSEARDRFRELLLQRALRAGGITAAQNWVDGIAEDDRNREYKQRAFGDVVETMLYRDPAAAARWISEMDGRGYVGAEAVTNTAVKLAESSPTGALEWLATLKPADAKGVAKGAGTVLQQWAQQDAQAAGAWLQRNTVHPFYDRLALGFVRTVVSTDPNAAKDWAETVRDEELRGKAMAALNPQDQLAKQGTVLTFDTLYTETDALHAENSHSLVAGQFLTEAMALKMRPVKSVTKKATGEFVLERKNPHVTGAQWRNCAQCHPQ